MNLDHLENLAKAATPEPWDEAYVLGAVRHIARNVENDVFLYEDVDFCWDRYNDGPFIAAANPQTVLALISVARAAQAYCDEPPFHPGDPDTRFAELSAALAALGR